MNRSVLLVPLLLAGLAFATGDPRGWSEGQPAANSAAFKSQPEIGEIELPKAFTKTLTGPTLLVYFSPTCPHCRHVAPELGELAKSIEGRAELVMVASSSSTDAALTEWKATFGGSYRIIVDGDREIGSAMGIRSTPSALLVKPAGRKVSVLDAYYPFTPGYSSLVEMRLADFPFQAFAPGEYQGTAACSACHTQEAEAWALSHHSIAWRTLVLDEEHENRECTDCHVTGAGQPTGWDGTEGSHLVNVGCESCHGPGGPHDGTKTSARSTCEGCHDAKHSIAFSYEKGLPHLDHFRANGMSDEDFRAARQSLGDGTAPRPLLAFGAGKNVGAEACKECHADEHAQWAASPHASAMARLDETQQADASCVRCHATATESGPPPTDLTHFRTDDSVGCESCHGPGEQHVAEGGGKDNIEGLGEDCPVCVIEAVCTGCHTAEWDKTWDLDTKLPKAGHDG
ncbi:MAG: redoxin family protein [Proteobacteria bacterium]|nr:redoxin family protein [Pseudomonadota bacterium]